MKLFEKTAEQAVRSIAQQTSRRGILGRLGAAIVGTAALPLLPMGRAYAEEPKRSGRATPPLSPGERGDPTQCDYWRYCGLSGPLCACNGGSANTCPPGTEMSPLAWVGTCVNPVDGKNYIISYNDCCGKTFGKRCMCDRASDNPDNRPPVRPQESGRYIWCHGTKESTVTCTTANVLGVALDQR